jgi:YggT family protein
MIKIYLINFANLLINILLVLIFVRVILSWIPSGLGRFRVFIYEVTEPILYPLRKFIPPVGGMLDLSPIVAFLILTIIQSFINRF